MLKSAGSVSVRALVLSLTCCLAGCGGDANTVIVKEKTIAQLQADLSSKKVTSVQLVDAYLDRITRLDQSDPGVHAVLALNPDARDDAAALDAERASTGARGPLHGIPILIKDNIETADPTPTTAGSLALKDNLTLRDAPIVAAMRAAGAIILGKTNLSEWAAIRSDETISGWSAVGGFTHNPYSLDRSPCGSSAGSAAAVTASMAAAAVGTETNGSIVCPSNVNGVVGLKPTVGLLSRTNIVPISQSQDTAGPIGRTVADVAVLLSSMAGTDPADPATATADQHKQDYVAALRPDALAGKRLGVLTPFLAGLGADLQAAFTNACAALTAAGAELVDIDTLPSFDVIDADELNVLLTELRVDLNAYLATTPAAVTSRTLADLIAFDLANPGTEMPYFQQDLFVQADATAGLDDPDYLSGLAQIKAAAGPSGIDALLSQNNVDALITPTGDPAWVIDTGSPDPSVYGDSALAAVAGCPHLTVPMALIGGLPVGLSFVGAAWSEADLLAFGYAFEQQTQARQPPPD
jgi:amidase